MDGNSAILIAARMRPGGAAGEFSHADATRLSKLAMQCCDPVVVIDLSQKDRATTAAFAQLIVLRQMLVRQGRDLLLTGLCGATASLHEILRLDRALPSLGAKTTRTRQRTIDAQPATSCSWF
jgi:hypothetical protein